MQKDRPDAENGRQDRCAYLLTLKVDNHGFKNLPVAPFTNTVQPLKSLEWISNFIPHFIMDVITYPCWE